MRQNDLSGRLARWALKLQGFNFTIEHRRGKDNVVPDALSRNFGMENIVSEIEVKPLIDLDSDAFSGDEYSKWRDEIKRMELPDFKVVDKLIYRRTKFSDTAEEGNNSWKLVVPTELRSEILYTAHDIPNSSHAGIAKTVEVIRRYFYWPKLVADVKDYIGKCDVCKTTKVPARVLRPPMGNMVITERPFQRLYVDIIGPLPRTRNGNIGIFIVLDHFSKFSFLRPMKKLLAKPIVSYLRDEIFTCYGVPEVVVSDNGTQFKGKDFETSMYSGIQPTGKCKRTCE